MSAERYLLVTIYDDKTSHVLELPLPARYEVLLFKIVGHLQKSATDVWKVKKPGSTALVDLRTLSGEVSI
jgi:hypothetical protein